jgi:hypothetical protein
MMLCLRQNVLQRPPPRRLRFTCQRSDVCSNRPFRLSWRSRLSLFYLMVSIIIIAEHVKAFGGNEQVLDETTCSNDNGESDGGNSCVPLDDDGGLGDALTPSITDDDDDEPEPDEPDDEDVEEARVRINLGVEQNLDGEEFDLERQDIENFLRATRNYVLRSMDFECQGDHENCAIWR